MFNQNYRRFETKDLSVTFKLQLTCPVFRFKLTSLRCNKGQKMQVEFCIFGKVNFIGIKTSRQLTCLYTGPLIFFCLRLA